MEDKAAEILMELFVIYRNKGQSAAIAELARILSSVASAERERCATVNVIDRKWIIDNPDYDAGWFDGVEAALDAIRNQD